VELYFYFLNTSSWRGARLKKSQGQLYVLPIVCIYANPYIKPAQIHWYARYRVMV